MKPVICRPSGQSWHPSYWLAALGAGGLSVSFFMYLMWLLPHDTPMPTWVDVSGAWRGTTQLAPGVSTVVLIATLCMVMLAVLHFVLVLWNLREQKQAVQRGEWQAFLDSPAELQLLAQPLTLTMSVNVAFALGAVLVPGLWHIVEWLFPLAMIAFAVLGFWVLRSYGRYFSRLLVDGGYREKEHNHLSALIAVFSMAMVSVGFAAPAAMSTIALTTALAGTLSLLFFVVAVATAFLVLFAGIQSMLKYGLQPKATPSIWMLVPIMTLLGIEWVRMQHGLDNHFAMALAPGKLFVTLTGIFMLQLSIMGLGYKMMQLNGYLRDYLHGSGRDPVSFGLICPGVAIVVMGMFWWHLVWVDFGLVTAYGPVHWLGIAVLALGQLLTGWALVRLSMRLLRCQPVVIASMQ